VAEGQSARRASGAVPARKPAVKPVRKPVKKSVRKPVKKSAGTSAAKKRLTIVARPQVPRTKDEKAAASRRSLLLLLIPTAILLVLGLTMVLSAGSISAVEGYGTSFWYFQRQLVYAVAGGAALVVAWRMPYRVWQRLAVPMMLVILPLMVIAYLRPSSATALYGASRWIDIGGYITLQPSEFMKLGLVVFTATILTKKWKRLDEPLHLLLPLAPVVLLVSVIVILQRDLGTTVILCGSVFLMLFVAGVRGRYLGVTAAVAGAGGAMLILGESYRRTRFIDAWLTPMADAKGAGYQLIQGLIALGSGGWFGVGLGNSHQKWNYLPNAHSDFIFAIIGEELGLIGAIVTLLIFATLLYAGIRIAVRAPDTFGRLLAAGIISWIGLQVIINMGSVTGLLPITGVPLPLVSFGGTALVATLAGVGVLASIARGSGPAGTRSRRRRRRASSRGTAA
jgi:cell division protein FtsW